LKKSKTYIVYHRTGYILFAILFFLFVTSCNPTKYVPEGESLLNKNYITVNKEGIKKSDLVPFLTLIKPGGHING